jgi:C1A family cysteine protease
MIGQTPTKVAQIKTQDTVMVKMQFSPNLLIPEKDEHLFPMTLSKQLVDETKQFFKQRSKQRQDFLKKNPKYLFKNEPPKQILKKALPSYFSLRDQGMVTPVKNQNPYGTCWAFAAIGALESSYLMRSRDLLDLSEQDLINCNCRACDNSHQNPNWTNSAAMFKNTGVTTENKNPYAGDGSLKDKDGNCDLQKVETNCGTCNHDYIYPYRLEAVGSIDNSGSDEHGPIQAIKTAIMEHGAVVTKLHIPKESSAFGDFNGTGVIDEAPSPTGNNCHFVDIVGWDNNRNAWQIKNSWGTGWRNQGFGWLAYGSDGIGLLGTYWYDAKIPDFRATAVWRSGKSDIKQVYGWSYENYRKEYDELWNQGWRLRFLKNTVTNGEVLYSAVWEKGNDPEIQLYGSTYDQYRKKYDELWNQGWRLYILNNYVVNGTVYYTAVWRKGTQPELQVYGWKYSDYRKKYDELWNQGWRLYLLNNFVLNGEVLYTAVWRNSTEPEIQVYGWKYPDYRAKYDKLWKDGWRLGILTNYVLNGCVYYTAVWHKSSVPEFQVYSWEYQDFRSKDFEMRNQDWHLEIVNLY